MPFACSWLVLAAFNLKHDSEFNTLHFAEHFKFEHLLECDDFHHSEDKHAGNQPERPVKRRVDICRGDITYQTVDKYGKSHPAESINVIGNPRLPAMQACLNKTKVAFAAVYHFYFFCSFESCSASVSRILWSSESRLFIGGSPSEFSNTLRAQREIILIVGNILKISD